MVDNYLPSKVLDKIKEIISIENFDDTKISFYTDDELPDGIALKSGVIPMAYLIKDDGKFCHKILAPF